MIKAVIDIGTNTAHLLIAEVVKEKIVNVLYKKRFYIYLAEHGIQQIHHDAIHRLFKSLNHFTKSIAKYNAQNLICIGTEALRTAQNGSEIINTVKEKYNFDIESISGIQEAQYIFQGVRQIYDLSLKNCLIVDIGGGSVELIYTESGNIKSINSYPIGIANLYNRFHKNDPIHPNQIQELRSYLHDVLDIPLSQIKESNIDLIGSAGTFEIFNNDNDKSDDRHIVNTNSSQALLTHLISLNESDRIKTNSIPKERAKYIVVALLLIDFLVKELSLKRFMVSPFALKEGIIISQ